MTRSYLSFALNTFRQRWVYRKNFVLGMVGIGVRLVFLLFAWRALYASVAFESVAGRSYEVMQTYVLVSMLVQSLTSGGQISTNIEERMKSGEIGVDFLRPLSTRGIYIAQSWGEKTYTFIMQIVPVLLVGLVMGGVRPPASLGALVLFLVTVALGYVINLLLDLLAGCLAFWFVSVNTIEWFTDFCTLALSGAIVPLWMLPSYLRAFAMALPFQSIVYAPTQVYIGGLSSGEVLRILLVQCCWIVGLFLLQEFLWRKSVRKIVVHGG